MIALAGAHIFSMTGPIADGNVLIDEGKVVACGNVAIPREAEVYDLDGRCVLPGLIDSHTHVGIMEEIYRVEGDDTNEVTDPVTPHLRAIDGINPADIGFADALSGGVTTVVITPGSANVLGGEMAILKTSGKVLEEMLVRAPAGMKAALGENPKRNYGRDKKMPFTRMASAAMLRETLFKAQNYAPGQGREKDLKLETLLPVLRQEIPLRVHAHRADDIMTAVRIAEEFNLKIIIEHGTESYLVADLLARRKIPVILGPLLTNRPKVEMAGVNPRAPYLLHQAGVKFAFMTDHPVVPIQHLLLSAAMTVRHGLPEEECLKAVTTNAAEILGLSHLGTIAPGSQADLVVLSGDPFDLRTKVEKVFLAGKLCYNTAN